MTDWWMYGVSDVCAHFQVDLSCLVDGELDDAAGVRAMAHLEACEPCREFFEDTRLQVRAHRDMVDPAPLAERFAILVGRAGEDVDVSELVHKLATIFYQVGKAYLLLELRPERTSIFEEAVKIEDARARGRGFVDGVVARGSDGLGGVDWTSARGMLNGKLSRVEGALAKGRRLIEEALNIDPDHEEARLYLGYLHAHDKKPLRAQREFERLFEHALDVTNRAHAATQLAKMHAVEGDYRRALVYSRWVTMSGVDELDERFYYARFNIGMYWAHLRRSDRSVASFRTLLDRHPERAAEVAGYFANSPWLRSAIDSQEGFAELLITTCPELFRSPDGAEVSDDNA